MSGVKKKPGFSVSVAPDVKTGKNVIHRKKKANLKKTRAVLKETKDRLEKEKELSNQCSKCHEIYNFKKNGGLSCVHGVCKKCFFKSFSKDFQRNVYGNDFNKFLNRGAK